MRHTHRSLVVIPVCLGLLTGLSAAPASAQGSAWIAEPGTGNVSFSFVRQFTDKYFRSENSLPVDRTLPATLSQNTFWFGFNYALTDAVAIDVQSGAASSLFPGPPAGTPTTSESFAGLVDTNVALTWRVVDELVSAAPSVALRVGAIAAGGYETGHINALGDGGSGFEGRSSSASSPSGWAPVRKSAIGTVPRTSRRTCSSTGRSSCRPAAA